VQRGLDGTDHRGKQRGQRLGPNRNGRALGCKAEPDTRLGDDRHLATRTDAGTGQITEYVSTGLRSSGVAAALPVDRHETSNGSEPAVLADCKQDEHDEHASGPDKRLP